MKVVYTAPNKGHHYRYALAMNNGRILSKFISGFSRFSPRSAIPEIGGKLCRADFLQNAFLASLKFNLPFGISSSLAYMAKIEQDYISSRYVSDADIFLFYNGSGLKTCKKIQGMGGIGIVEAVNSHVLYQETILRDEFEKNKLPWQPFHKEETKRRLEEYEQADYILLPSDFVKNSFLEFGFSEHKLLKVPYGFNQFILKSGNTPNVNKKVDEFRIVYVGSISVRKGVRYLIEAFNKINHPNKKLVIVGPTSSPTGIENVNVSSNITFAGILKGDDLEQVYRSADVFCLPSLEEGLALVLGEALSYGIPIVATTNSGASEIITDGVEGFIVEPKDVMSLFDRLQNLIDDPYLLDNMKNASLKKALTLKGWNDTGELLNTTLKEVHKNHNS